MPWPVLPSASSPQLVSPMGCLQLEAKGPGSAGMQPPRPGRPAGSGAEEDGESTWGGQQKMPSTDGKYHSTMVCSSNGAGPTASSRRLTPLMRSFGYLLSTHSGPGSAPVSGRQS